MKPNFKPLPDGSGYKIISCTKSVTITKKVQFGNIHRQVKEDLKNILKEGIRLSQCECENLKTTIYAFYANNLN